MIEPEPFHLGVLVFPGCVRSAAVVPGDVLALANRLAAPGPGPGPMQAQWVSARGTGEVDCEGLRFQAEGMALNGTRPPAWDALLVPGFSHEGSDWRPTLAKLAPEIALIQTWSDLGRPLLASCTGVILLAAAGVLDGLSATTSWWLIHAAQRHHPEVSWQPADLLCAAPGRITAAGLTAYHDLTLWLVQQHLGDDLARQTGKLLLLEPGRSSQAPYLAQTVADGTGPALLERAQHWLNQRLNTPWTLSELAAHCYTSERTLLRRFRQSLGVTPVQYTQQLRVERAKALLEGSTLSLEAIAEHCGYLDVSTLRKVFKHWTQLTPREYRQRFGLRV